MQCILQQDIPTCQAWQHQQHTEVDHTSDLCHNKAQIKLNYTMQEQQQQHESASLVLAAAQEEVQHLSSVKKQADAVQNELAAVQSAHEALQGELAVAKGRLSGFDESCQLSLDRVQSLSAALQEAQQAKVESSLSFFSECHLCHSCLSPSPLFLLFSQPDPVC